MELHTADLHYGLHREKIFYGKSMNDLISESLDQIIQYALEHMEPGRPAVILIHGDVYHTKRPLPDDELHFVSFLNKCIEKQVHVVAYEGNHEANEYGVTAFSMLAEMYRGNKYIHIITQPMMVVIPKATHSYLCVPHIHNKDVPQGKTLVEHFMDTIKKLSMSLNENIASMPHVAKEVILCGHFEHPKAVPGSEKLLLANGANLITEFTNMFKAIISGHVHKPQVIDENFYYCGSVVCNDISEREDQKGFIAVTEDKIKFKPVKTLKWDRVEIDMTPKLIKGKKREALIARDYVTLGIGAQVGSLEGKVAHVVINYAAATKDIIDFDGLTKFIKESVNAEFVFMRQNVDEKKAVEKSASKVEVLTPKNAVMLWIDAHCEANGLKDKAKSIKEKALEVVGK